MICRWTSGIILFASMCPRPALAESLPGAPIQYLRTVPSVHEFTKPKSIFSKVLNWVAGAADKPELTRPYATAQDSVGRLLVADPGQKGVHIYDFEKHKYQFLKGPRGNLFESPIDVACDRNDNIYVTDSVRRRIYVFDTRGKFLRDLGAAGAFLRPTGIALDRSARQLYVADTLRHQVLVLGLDGTLIRSIGSRGTGEGQFNF